MNKHSNNFQYVYKIDDVSEQERILCNDIAELELQLDAKREVDRYVYKYMSDFPSNIEKVLKIVNIELLPDDLQAAFKQAEKTNTSTKSKKN